jgi:4'-phosphopantetheinyl transferase EntD
MPVPLHPDIDNQSAEDGLSIESFAPVPESIVVQAVIGPAEVALPSGFQWLHGLEQEFARSRPGRRRSEFVAGRRALRAALRRVGWADDMPLLTGPRGQPAVPGGFTASLTHKDGLVIAIAAPATAGRTLGIDCEVAGDRDRNTIAPKVLRATELERWQAGGSLWPALLETFSTKEAIYKALHPHVPRYIGFEEAEVLADGQIRLHLSHQEGPFALRRYLDWHVERLVVVVEARPLSR